MNIGLRHTLWGQVDIAAQRIHFSLIHLEVGVTELPPLQRKATQALSDADGEGRLH